MHMRKHCTVLVMMAEADELAAHAHNNGICSVRVKSVWITFIGLYKSHMWSSLMYVIQPSCAIANTT